MEAFGIAAEEIDITGTARLMLENIGHAFADGEPVYDTAFENVQAGLRTDYLFRLASQHGGWVIGTGDLSELALGWCTYGVGDQMSHYGVNAGVPKTLIQYLIRWTTQTAQFDEGVDAVLADILDTEISPELVPAGEDGQIQSTQSIIGPYELNDFFLHHVVRWGSVPAMSPSLAWHAWKDAEARLWPIDFPEEAKRSVRPRDDRGLAGKIPQAVLRFQPIQALGNAQWAQGQRRQGTEPARRLACAERFGRRYLACRTGRRIAAAGRLTCPRVPCS